MCSQYLLINFIIDENDADLDEVQDILDIFCANSQQFKRLMMNLGKHHNEEQQLQTHSNS